MIKKYSLVLAAIFCFVLSGFGQVNINQLNTNFTTNFNSWNGTLPTGFNHVGENTTYIGSGLNNPTGGLYDVNNSGYGYQPSGSADNLTLIGEYINTTGAVITELEITYEAFSIYHRTSRLPGWTVTTALGDVSGLNWSYNQTATNTAPDVMTV
ncbi:hypothetical protein, partial [Xanthomarina gelatinilytica]|uniref:hypothetical protein n=1 Tax=Xanthomarina gelatinilytica TaxID=1137281 RepID=UPI003AA91A3F